MCAGYAAILFGARRRTLRKLPRREPDDLGARMSAARRRASPPRGLAAVDHVVLLHVDDQRAVTLAAPQCQLSTLSTHGGATAGAPAARTWASTVPGALRSLSATAKSAPARPPTAKPISSSNVAAGVARCT